MTIVASPGQRGPAAQESPRRKNVFLIGLNDFNRAKLETVTNAESYNFYSLLEEPHDYDLPRHLAEAERRLHAFDGPIDAVVGYMDFPVSTMLPLLCRRFGLPAPTLEAMLKCEHKYWSRVEQQTVIPEHVPRFAAVDPFDDHSVAAIPLAYPFWIKPVKSSGSYLGFYIDGPEALDRAVREIRRGIDRLAVPFQYVLDRADLPPDIKSVDGRHCIAEEIISGWQCTLEGWVFKGEVDYHGVVDSVREPNGSSFSRYEYPSTLPEPVLRHMADAGRRVLRHVGFDNSGFNIEFRWDEQNDKLWLLEINTRVAQHHSDLFEKVDGTTNHEVPIQIGLGRAPHIPHRQGRFARAATFFLRHYEDGVVTRVPDRDTIAALETRIPGTVIQLQVSAGKRLSDIPEQDSYSYFLAIIYVGAQSQEELLERYSSIVDELEFEFASET